MMRLLKKKEQNTSRSVTRSSLPGFIAGLLLVLFVAGITVSATAQETSAATTGFQIKTADKAKGQFAFEFTGHYSMSAQDTVPYELYVRVGGEEPGPTPTTPSVTLDKETLALTVSGDSATLVATTVPAGETVTWTSSDENVATVTSGGVVSPEGAGTATITATITVDETDYTDTCAVTVTE